MLCPNTGKKFCERYHKNHVLPRLDVETPPFSTLLPIYQVCKEVATCFDRRVLGGMNQPRHLFLYQPAIAAMHGPHSVFDIGHGMVIHCDAGGVSLIDR